MEINLIEGSGLIGVGKSTALRALYDKIFDQQPCNHHIILDGEDAVLQAEFHKLLDEQYTADLDMDTSVESEILFLLKRRAALLTTILYSMSDTATLKTEYAGKGERRTMANSLEQTIHEYRSGNRNLEDVVLDDILYWYNVHLKHHISTALWCREMRELLTSIVHTTILAAEKEAVTKPIKAKKNPDIELCCPYKRWRHTERYVLILDRGFFDIIAFIKIHLQRLEKMPMTPQRLISVTGLGSVAEYAYTMWAELVALVDDYTIVHIGAEMTAEDVGARILQRASPYEVKTVNGNDDDGGDAKVVVRDEVLEYNAALRRIYSERMLPKVKMDEIAQLVATRIFIKTPNNGEAAMKATLREVLSLRSRIISATTKNPRKKYGMCMCSNDDRCWTRPTQSTPDKVIATPNTVDQ